MQEKSFSKATLVEHYTFAQGNPVPDGMPFSYITETHHPSNIAVFHADNILDASDKALHAFKHGKQGAIWLDANDLRCVEGQWENFSRDKHIFDYMDQATSQLKTKFSKFVANSLRVETVSNFDPHFDGTPLKLSDHFIAPHVTEFRILIDFGGIPTVVFGKNSVLASKIIANTKNIPVKEYGHAYISPLGSALFISRGNKLGLRNCLLHAVPEVSSSNGEVVRDLAVIDCDVK